MKPSTGIYINNAPYDLIVHYRSHCIRRGLHMREEIIKWMESVVANPLLLHKINKERATSERHTFFYIRDINAELKQSYTWTCEELSFSVTCSIISYIEMKLDEWEF